MNVVSNVGGAIVNAPEKAGYDKLVRAAHQFEAVLLNSLLGSLEHSFTSLAGKETEAGSDTYRSLGLQTLASSLAAKGGLGIADLIVRKLREASGSPDNKEKSLSKSASVERLL
jgi:Rod binding domain-containing protein